MEKWENFGDINYIEHGGTLLRQDSDVATAFYFINVAMLDIGGGDYVPYAAEGYIDAKDFEEKLSELSECFGSTITMDDPQKVVLAAISYYGVISAAENSSPLVDYSAITDCHELNSMSSKAKSFVLSHYELEQYLNSVGFEAHLCDYENCAEPKEFSDSFETLLYNTGEIDDFRSNAFHLCLDENGEPLSDRSAVEQNIYDALSDPKEVSSIITHLDDMIGELSSYSDILDAQYLKGAAEEIYDGLLKEQAIEK